MGCQSQRNLTEKQLTLSFYRGAQCLFKNAHLFENVTPRHKDKYIVITKPQWVISIIAPMESLAYTGLNIRNLTESSQQRESLQLETWGSKYVKATQQQAAAGIPPTCLFSSITCAANPGPLEDLGSLCTAQRSTREGEGRAEIQPWTLALGCYPEEKTRFLQIFQKHCMKGPLPYSRPLGDGMSPYLGHSSSRTHKIPPGCPPPISPSSSALSYSKYM